MPSTSVTVAEHLAHFISKKATPGVFQLSGGMIAFISDAISRLGITPVINNRHEQAAGFAGEGATRIAGIPAVVMATSGPGASNLVTAIGSAFFDSTPVIFITGQVKSSERKLSSDQRQNGFQELDIVKLVKEITKLAITVSNGDELSAILNLAWEVAQTSRPGPVLIDIPIDVQQLTFNPELQYQHDSPGVSGEIDDQDLVKIKFFMQECRRPLLLVGGGIRIAKQVQAFRLFSQTLGIPVVYSLMGVDAVDHSTKFHVGMIGSYGNRWANQALKEADLIMVLGSRLDERQTGNSVAEFSYNKKIIRIDIDDSELKGRVKANLSINLALRDFLKITDLPSISIKGEQFMAEICEWRDAKPQNKEQISEIDLNPNDLIIWISQIFRDSNGYIVDVGQHQMWAAQSIQLGTAQRFITSGGMGAMGFALPAAIGAATTKAGKWVVIQGDGCAQLSLPELQTVRQYNLPIAICIFNNGQHGMVAQFQEENMSGRFYGTRDGYSAPDFTAVASSFGIPSLKVSHKKDLKSAKKFIKNWESGPILIEFLISIDAKALPKLPRSTE